MSRKSWFYFSVVALIWGLPYLLIRVAVRQLDPGILVFLRTAPASLMLLPVVLYRKQFRFIRENLLWIFVFGVVEFALPWFMMGAVEQHLSSSLTSLMICTVPFVAIALQKLRGHHEHLSRKRVSGLLIGIVGVGFLVGLNLSGGTVAWFGLGFAICVGYALGPIILHTRLQHVPGPAVVCGATGFSALLWAPWALSHWPAHIGSETIECVAVLTVFCTALVFLAFFELIKLVGAARATVVTYVNTAVAVTLGIVGLHEPLSSGIMIGFPLVLIGSYFATSAPKAAVATS
jgi:drug/metabolite transporter (DMT)-like permease